MSGPHSETEDAKQVSVAELLARNGTIGEPTVTRRRRRRRGDDSVSVAELTGEIPIIRDDPRPPDVAPAKDDVEAPQQRLTPPAPAATAPSATPTRVEPVVTRPPEPVVQPTPDRPAATVAEPAARPPYWSEPEPRWPKSDPFTKRSAGPERSEYPRPLRHTSVRDGEGQSGAEGMSPDPVGHYTDASVDVMDSEVREAETSAEDSAYVRSYLHGPGGPDSHSEQTLFGGQSIADEVARRRGDQQTPAVFAEDQSASGNGAAPRRPGRKMAAVGSGILTVLQSILAVAFGGGLFIAFDQLWRWNAIVALVLSVLVILGLVVGVRVVRKTEDIASTLIAVAVGALITLGPMALLQTG